MSLWKTWQLSRKTFASWQGCSLILLISCLNKTNKLFTPLPLRFSDIPTALSCSCWSWVCERRDNCHEGHLHHDLWSRCISCSICFAACPIQFSRDVTLINLIKREEEKENACSLSHNVLKNFWNYFWIIKGWSVQMLLLKDFKPILLCTAGKEPIVIQDLKTPKPY